MQRVSFRAVEKRRHRAPSESFALTVRTSYPRRRRAKLRPVVVGPLGWDGQSRRALWIPATRSSTTACERWPIASRSTCPPPPRRRPLPGDGSDSLHDDRRGRRRALRAAAAAGRHSHPPRGLEALPGEPRRERAFARAPTAVRGRIRWLTLGVELELTAAGGGGKAASGVVCYMSDTRGS